MQQKGKYLVIEGTDGSGKTTVSAQVIKTAGPRNHGLGNPRTWQYPNRRSYPHHRQRWQFGTHRIDRIIVIYSVSNRIDRTNSTKTKQWRVGGFLEKLPIVHHLSGVGARFRYGLCPKNLRRFVAGFLSQPRFNSDN